MSDDAWSTIAKLAEAWAYSVGMKFGIAMALLLPISLFPLRSVGQDKDSVSPQSSMQEGAPHCFSIHLRLNGAKIDGPQVIVLKTKQIESTAYLEHGCFKVPPALLTNKALDVSFRVSGSRVYLSAIAAGLFSGPWDIDLADKKFGSGVRPPKHTLAKEACAVVFHVGEPERALVQAPCRTSE